MMLTRSTLVQAISLCLLLQVGYAQPADNEPHETRPEVRAFIAAFEKEHVTRRALEPDLTRRWILEFVDHLDPQRMYFLQRDVDEFQLAADQLAKSAREGDVRFPQRVREQFRSRVPQAMAIAADCLSRKQDFTIDEKCPRRFDKFAATVDELRERWRLRIKLECLIEKLHGRKPREIEAQLTSRFQRILWQSATMTDDRLYSIYLESLAATYDPNSQYLSQEFVESFSQTMTFRTYTLGLAFRQEAGRFVIASVDPALRDSTKQDQVVGWSLVAIRRLEGSTFDLIELHPDDLHAMVYFSHRQLQDDSEVVLELLNPVTYERQSLSWSRVRTDRRRQGASEANTEPGVGADSR